MDVRAVAGVLALDPAGHVLLVRRAEDGTRGLPGGGLEVGKTWLEAAVRECREETGGVLDVAFFSTDVLPAPLFAPDRPVLLDFASGGGRLSSGR